MASFSRPSSRASTHSQAPIPPPKPVHLTLSLRHGQAKAYPSMPRWSRAASVFGEGEDGEVAEAEEEEDEEEGGGSTLHAVARAGRGGSVGWGGTVGEGGRGSTLRPAGAAKTKGTRLSIMFDLTVDNPLGGLGTVKQLPQPPLAPEGLSGLEAATVATDGGAQDDGPPNDADVQGSEEMMLDISGEALAAVSTHAFEGEAAFGELSFGKGVELMIEVEDLGGNWSLGWLAEEGEGGRGLVPLGFYKLMQSETCPDTIANANAAVGDPATRATPPPQPRASSAAIPAQPSTVPTVLATRELTSHFPILNLFADELPSPSAPLPPHTPTRTPTASAWHATLTPDLASNPGTPRTPYSPRSIGRNVIVSGVEFEATELVPVSAGETGASYFPRQPTPPVRAAELAGDEGEEVEQAAVAEQASQETAPRQLTPEPAFGWPGLPTPLAIESDWTPTKVRNPVQPGLPATPPSAQKAWASDGPRSSTREPSITSNDEAADCVPPLAPFALASGARLSLTDSRAAMGFRDTEVRPYVASECSELEAPSEPPSASLLAQAVETIGRGYNSLLLGAGLDAAEGASLRTGADRLPVEARYELEEWILGGDGALLRLSLLGEGPVFHVESGAVWRPRPAGQAFTVHVHSPAKRHSLASGDYTVFQLTTVFPAPEADPAEIEFAHAQSRSGEPAPATATATVDRRYSHFVRLHGLLRARYPVLGLPDLPGKSFKGRFDPAFVESRRRDLERWLSRVGRHPVLGEADELRGFLVIEEERELEGLLSGAGAEGEGVGGVGWFLSRVLHPDFNVDAEEAEELGDRFGRHSKAVEVGGGVRHVEEAVEALRGGLTDLSSKFTGLARSLTRLVAGQALPPLALDHAALGSDAVADVGQGEGERQRQRARAWCLQSEQGGYTHKEDDDEGLSLAKAVQAAGEAMAGVVELYDEQARTSLLPVQELLREAAYPHSQNAHLLTTHRQLLSFQTLLASLPVSAASAEALARTDTLLNLTAAELAHAHASHQADLRQAAEDLLDAQVAMHRAALDHLEFARSHFAPGAYEALAQTGPRLRSRVERDAGRGPRGPLVMPSGYGLPRGLLGRRLTEGMGSVLFGGRGTEGGAGATGGATIPTAETVRRPSVAEILAAQERGEMVGWRGSFLDSGTTSRTSAWA